MSFRTDPVMAGLLAGLPDPDRFMREAVLAKLVLPYFHKEERKRRSR